MSGQPKHSYCFVNPNNKQEMQKMLQILAAEQLKRWYREGKQEKK